MNKTCTKCRQTKPIEEFGVYKRSPDGHKPRCKVCYREDNNNAYAELPDDKKVTRYEKAKQWVSSHREKMTEWQRSWRRSHPEKTYQINQKYYESNPEIVQAHRAVAYAVNRKRIQPADSFVCSACKTKQAQDYHHYMGYAKEHRLDVIPLCRACHRKIDSHIVT